MRCKDCKFWEIANTRHGSPSPTYTREAYAFNPEDMPPPHANLDWAECTKAVFIDGPEDHIQAPKMAVFDGSEYYASLWTRCDHLCAEFSPREPNHQGEMR